MRAGLFLGIGVLLTAMPGALKAQTGAEAGIATTSDCARRASPQEELACLRGALAARETLDWAERGADPSREVASPQPAAIAPTQLGAEQVADLRPGRDDREEAPMLATVSHSQVDHLGRLTIRLNNGQTWQQAEPRAVPLRLEDGVEQVEISHSGFGGYRLRLPESGRRFAVRRVQ